MGASQVAQPSGNPGMIAAATAQVLEAVRMLQAAMQLVPVGTNAHKSVVDSIAKLSKNFSQSEASPCIQKTAMLSNLQSAQEQSPQIAMMRAMAGQEAAGAAPTMQ